MALRGGALPRLRRIAHVGDRLVRRSRDEAQERTDSAAPIAVFVVGHDALHFRNIRRTELRRSLRQPKEVWETNG
jgi:hypothetical protein